MMRLIALCFCLTTPVSAGAETPKVVTDIAPVHALVSRVMEGVGTPDLILPQEASPHGYALHPSQVVALQDANLVIWVGPNLTPWLESSMDTLGAKADQLILLDIPGTVLLPWREEFELRDEDGDHGQDHDHDHGAEAVDPHVWLDPQNGAFWLVAIAEMLSVHDAENANLYRANAHAGQAELAGLIEQITKDLDGLEDMRYVVSHDALHYFETRFEVHAAGAVSHGDAAETGAARLAHLQGLISKHEITCMLVEPGMDTARLRNVFGENVQFAEVDLLGRNHAPGAGLYPALLRDIAGNLAECAIR